MFDELIEIRQLLKDTLTSAIMKNNMRNQGDIKGLEIVVISETNDPDSAEAEMFEGTLEDDREEFFFGA